MVAGELRSYINSARTGRQEPNHFDSYCHVTGIPDSEVTPDPDLWPPEIGCAVRTHESSQELWTSRPHGIGGEAVEQRPAQLRMQRSVLECSVEHAHQIHSLLVIVLAAVTSTPCHWCIIK